MCKCTPTSRWRDPQGLIGTEVFLSSKASDFVNGHLLFVDGGILVAAVVGFTEGMGAQAFLYSIQNGIGGMLGGLAIILDSGTMLGRLISDTGTTQRIATT